MIALAITEAERREAEDALARYTPDNPNHYGEMRKILTKLAALGDRPVRFTNREANVLMDALAERDSDVAEQLGERLTGRTP